jgi:hypothetical protein
MSIADQHSADTRVKGKFIVVAFDQQNGRGLAE